MAVDSNAKAKKALAAPGITIEEDFVSLEMPSRIGELQKAARLISDAGTNITYMYETVSTGRSSPCLLSTSDNKKTVRLIDKQEAGPSLLPPLSCEGPSEIDSTPTLHALFCVIPACPESFRKRKIPDALCLRE